MIDCNWMVKLAASNQKALMGYGYSSASVQSMDAREVTRELKKLGYDFKANSPLKSPPPSYSGDNSNIETNKGSR